MILKDDGSGGLRKRNNDASLLTSSHPGGFCLGGTTADDCPVAASREVLPGRQDLPRSGMLDESSNTGGLAMNQKPG